MLVLSRLRDESIIIGGGLIKVIVVDIRGDKVRLGIEATREMPVHREEVQRAILRGDKPAETPAYTKHVLELLLPAELQLFATGRAELRGMAIGRYLEIVARDALEERALGAKELASSQTAASPLTLPDQEVELR